jgi:hypothetical protein
VFDWGEFLQGEIFGRDTELQLKSGINSEEETGFFLTKEFLIQRGRGKNGIKNYRDDHHEFRDFW